MDIHSELINYVISEFQDFKYEPKSKPFNPSFVKKLKKALHKDYKKTYKNMKSNILSNIPDSLPYHQQDKKLMSKGIILLTNNREFHITTIDYTDEIINDSLHYSRLSSPRRSSMRSSPRIVNVTSSPRRSSMRSSPRIVNVTSSPRRSSMRSSPRIVNVTSSPKLLTFRGGGLENNGFEILPYVNLTRNHNDGSLVSTALFAIKFATGGLWNISAGALNILLNLVKYQPKISIKTLILIIWSYSLHVQPVPDDRSASVRYINSVIAGPARAFTYVENDSHFSHKLASGMIPGLVFDRVMDSSVLGGVLTIGSYYVTGIIVGGIRIYKRSYKIQKRTNEGTGRIIMKEIVKSFPKEIEKKLSEILNLGENIIQKGYNYSDKFKNYGDKFQKTAQNVANVKKTVSVIKEELKSIVRSLKQISERWLKQIFRLLNDIVDTFVNEIPKIVQNTLGIPYDKFKKIMCGMSEYSFVRWIGNGKYAKGIRDSFECDNVCLDGSCLGIADDMEKQHQIENKSIERLGIEFRKRLRSIKRNQVSEKIFRIKGKRSQLAQLHRLQKKFNNMNAEVNGKNIVKERNILKEQLKKAKAGQKAQRKKNKQNPLGIKPPKRSIITKVKRY